VQALDPAVTALARFRYATSANRVLIAGERFRRVLDDLVSPRYSADDLVRVWRRSPADENVQLSNGNQIREPLKAARERIRQHK
jgi:hypothetical protein